MITKKNLIVMIMIFIFSGCTINYDIEIKNNVVNEQIKIIESNEKINKDLVKKFQTETIYSQYNNSGIKEYQKKEEINGQNQIYSLKQEYKLMDYKFARALTECFDAVNIVKNEDNNYIFQTSKGFKCMIYDYYPIDAYKVNLTIDYEVIKNNADSVNGNIYTWNINSKNANNKYINIEFKEKIQEQEKQKDDKDVTKNYKEKNNNLIYIIAIIGIVVILLIFIIIYALKLNKKRNKL